MGYTLEPAAAVAIAACWVLPALLYFKLSNSKKPTFDLHAYQHDFLAAMAAQSGLSSAAAALEAIVVRAMLEPEVRAAMYDGFHCVHCGSKNPATWIKERKGKKEPYTLPVNKQVSSFLASDLLVPVEKLGEPPVRQVVPGPRKADPSKAARVAVDWAIQAYGALVDGEPKDCAAEDKKQSTQRARSPKRSKQ